MEIKRKYNTSSVIYFPLVTRDAADLTTAASYASGDIKLIKDGGTPANTTNGFVSEGNGIYSLTLTATEMTCGYAQIVVVDQTVPKVWEDQVILIQTYGNASAGLVFDFSSATVVASTVNALGANVITASAIATGALTNAKFAAGAIDATAIATGAFTNAKFADGFITAAKITDASFTNGKFDTGALSASKVNADLITAIQTGLATASSITTLTTAAGTLATSSALASVASDISTIYSYLGTSISTALTDIADGVSNVYAQTSLLPADPASASSVMQANITQIFGVGEVMPAFLASVSSIMQGIVVTGVTPSTTQFKTNWGGAYPNDNFKGRVLIFTSGALSYQAVPITGYNDSTKVLTYATTTGAPAIGDAFIIV